MEVSGRKADDILCESCLEDGKKLLAVGFCVNCCEYLCSLCYKHHCIPRLYKNHVLQDKETMPRTKPDSMTTEITDNGDKCSKHGGEIIKFYCRPDRQLGCGSCMTVNHRKCDNIVSIVEEYENFEKEIKDFDLQIDKNSKTKDQNSTEIENIHSKAIKDIKLFMSETRQFLESLENKMITDADKLKEKDDKKMKNISVTCMTLRNDLKSLTSDLSKLHKTQQNGKLFTMMEEARDQMKKVAKEIDEMKKYNKVENYTFVPENRLQELIGNVSALGTLDTELKHNPNYQTEMQKTSDEDGSSSTKTDIMQTNAKLALTAKQDKYVTSTIKSTAYLDNFASNNSTEATNMDYSTETEATRDRSDVKSIKINSQSSLETEKQKATSTRYSATASSSSSSVTGINQYPFKPRQVSKVTHITVQSSKDEQTPHITGIALLSDDQLVLADFGNQKVKLVNTKRNTLVTEIITSSQPWDITAVNNNLVAMTMPSTEKIQLLSVSNKKLSKGQTIKVNGGCRGIVHKDGTFVVTYTDPGKLEIISMSGNVLMFIDNHKGPNGEPLFGLPWYIALSPDNTQVYITDNGYDTVTCMTLAGKVQGVYKYPGYLNRPCGVTVDKSGSVYVVGRYLHVTYIIHQISGDCSQGQVLQGIEQEQTITYCHKEDKLFLGGQTRFIHVYQLK